MSDEQRQVARLDKVDEFFVDLEASKTDVEVKNTKIMEMSEKALQSFSQFDEARSYTLQEVKADMM